LVTVEKGFNVLYNFYGLILLLISWEQHRGLVKGNDLLNLLSLDEHIVFIVFIFIWGFNESSDLSDSFLKLQDLSASEGSICVVALTVVQLTRPSDVEMHVGAVVSHVLFIILIDHVTLISSSGTQVVLIGATLCSSRSGQKLGNA
jgi:hypothetical protein